MALNSTNPFNRPSPFRPSIDLKPSTSYSYSSSYTNIIQSQVKPINPNLTGRPSLSPYSNININSKANDYRLTTPYSLNNYTSSSLIPSNDNNYINPKISDYQYKPTSTADITNPLLKQNPFQRTSLLGAYSNHNQYYKLSTGIGSSINTSSNYGVYDVGVTNYDHLKYTPNFNIDMARIDSTNRIQSNEKYKQRTYSPNKYIQKTTTPNFNNYIDKSDTSSIATYINKINDLDQPLSPRGNIQPNNPFNKKSILANNANNKIGSQQDADTKLKYVKIEDKMSTGLDNYTNYSHLQYKGAQTNKKSKESTGYHDNTSYIDRYSYGLDKFKYQCQQQKKTLSNKNNIRHLQGMDSSPTWKYQINNQQQHLKSYDKQKACQQPYSDKNIQKQINNKYNISSSKNKSSSLQKNNKINKYQFEDYHEQQPQQQQPTFKYNMYNNEHMGHKNNGYYNTREDYGRQNNNNIQYNRQNNRQNNRYSKYKYARQDNKEDRNLTSSKQQQDRQYNFNRKQQYEYQLQRMQKILKPQNIDQFNTNYRNAQSNNYQNNNNIDSRNINSNNRNCKLNNKQQYQQNNILKYDYETKDRTRNRNKQINQPVNTINNNQQHNYNYYNQHHQDGIQSPYLKQQRLQQYQPPQFGTLANKNNNIIKNQYNNMGGYYNNNTNNSNTNTNNNNNNNRYKADNIIRFDDDNEEDKEQRNNPIPYNKRVHNINSEVPVKQSSGNRKQLMNNKYASSIRYKGVQFFQIFTV